MSAALDTNGFYSPLSWSREQLEQFALKIDATGCMDLGIVRAVQILMDADIATYESCQGGEGHAYREPTIRFKGTPACGWRALAILMTYGLPVHRLSRTWIMNYGVPDGPCWEITFICPLDLAQPDAVLTARAIGRPGTPVLRLDPPASGAVVVVVIDVPLAVGLLRGGGVIGGHFGHVETFRFFVVIQTPLGLGVRRRKVPATADSRTAGRLFKIAAPELSWRDNARHGAVSCSWPLRGPDICSGMSRQGPAELAAGPGSAGCEPCGSPVPVLTSLRRFGYGRVLALSISEC